MSFQFPDISKLWSRTKMIYNNVVYVGEKLKSDYEMYSKVYRNICRYYSKFNSRNPTELRDLEEILGERSKLSSATSRVFLENNDFIVVEELLEMARVLSYSHNTLMHDVMRVLSRDHSRYLDQSSHQRRFNKVLRSVHDSKLALEALYADTRHEGGLPPYEKIWYLYCLIERETLAICSLLESVEGWEKNVLNNSQLKESDVYSLPPIPYFARTKRACNTKQSSQKSTHNSSSSSSHHPDLWWETLRNYGNKSTTMNLWDDVPSNNHLRQCVLDPVHGLCRSADDLVVSENLKVNKWNLREPPQTSRTCRQPIFNNKASRLRVKPIISKPHGVVGQYQSKISTSSDSAFPPDHNTITVDSQSGRIVRFHDKNSTIIDNEKEQIALLNKRLIGLQNKVDLLLEERQKIEDKILNPLRHQMETGLDWMRSLYSQNVNAIESAQCNINKLKSEKSLIMNNKRIYNREK